MALQFRRGTAAQRLASTEIPAEGEPWFTYDDGQLYVGDGVTGGGVKIGSNLNLDDLTGVEFVSELTNTITSYAVTSNVVTITTATNHEYYAGLEVTIAGSSVAALNGTHTITLITGLNTFIFDLTLADIGLTSATGNIAPQLRDGTSLIWDATNERWTDGVAQIALYDLTNTDLVTTPPVDGQALVFEATGNEWVPGFPAMDIGDLGDVNTTTAPADGQYLVWDNTASKWKPSSISLDLGDINDVNLGAGPVNGQALIYQSVSNAWVPGAAGTDLLYANFDYTGSTAPTTVITDSDRLGRNFGTWTAMTAANQPTLFLGPTTTAFDPTLTGITFNATTGEFSGFSQGRYWINIQFTIVFNNPTPIIPTTPVLFHSSLATSATGSTYFSWDGLVTLLPYTSYGSVAATASVTCTSVVAFESASGANNKLTIYMDQDQGPTYYADYGQASFIRFAD